MSSPDIQRRFIIGDRYVYYKIYTGHLMQNRLLQNEIFHLVADLYATGRITGFFFIRYTDHDGSHLRLRFLAADPSALPFIIVRLHDILKEYVNARMVFKVMLDTYTREIERYGSSNILDVEKLFFYNSLEVIHLLREHAENSTVLWLSALQLINTFYDQLGYGWEEKHRVSRLFLDWAEKKISPGPASKEEIKKRYRENSPQIHQWITSPGTKTAPPLSKDIPCQEECLQHIVARYPPNSVEKDLILASLLHMMFNRLFSANQNTIEMVCYAMMEKYCRSRSAISKQSQKITA